jgi:hypothetical protein
MSQTLKTPAGQTVVQVSERYDSGTITVSAPNTTETSLVVLNTGVWREGVLLIKVTTISATTPQLIVNLWALDNSGNRYPLPGAAPANNGFIAKTYTAIGATRDSIPAPIGAQIEITYNTGTSSGATSIVFTVEAQFKSA